MRIVDPNDLQCQDKSADDQHMNDRPKVAQKSWTPSFCETSQIHAISQSAAA